MHRFIKALFLSANYYLFIICCLLFFSGCAGGPSSYFRLKPVSAKTHVKVAIIPFTNLTTEKEADKKVVYALITHLLNTNYFDIIEMGETEKVMKDAKARKDEGLSAENIKKIGELTGASVLLMGVIEEYKIDSSTMLGEKVFVPEFSMSTRLVSTKDASIIWAANHHRRGDDRVTIFGMGKIDSISKLTDIIIKDTVASLVKVVKNRQEALDILKNNPPKEKKTVCKIKPRKKIDKDDPRRIQAMEDALTQTAVAKPASASLPDSPLKAANKAISLQPSPDIRQEIKDDYKKEYEIIKKQY